MEIDIEQQVLNAIRDGIREGVKTKLAGYQSPLEKVIGDVLTAHSGEFRSMLDEGIASCTKDAKFREDICAAIRVSLAKTLIRRFGGEMEKQVNVLKSDPTTRARITIAIEDIVKSHGS